MRRIILTLIISLLTSSMFGQKFSKDNNASAEVGVVENEAIIKFNFQSHRLNQKSDYNITYFETALSIKNEANIEFWGHGNKTLSIIGPVVLHLNGKEISNFYNILKAHYFDFQKNIRMKSIAFEHSDLLVFESNEFIFSCYMNDKTPEYAFWINKQKYKIDERALNLLFSRIESYFKTN